MRPDQVDRLIAAFEPGLFIQPDSVRSAFRPPFQFNVLDEQSALNADFWILRDDAFERTAFGRRMQVLLFAGGNRRRACRIARHTRRRHRQAAVPTAIAILSDTVTPMAK